MHEVDYAIKSMQWSKIDVASTPIPRLDVNHL